MLAKLTKNAKEVGSTALDLGLLRYPRFVYGRELNRTSIPVFCLHSAEYATLDATLGFLQRNGYTTLDADEYYDVLTGRLSAPARAVVLTFDDGWGSMWSIGYPLFRKYGTKVVVFIPPGRIEHEQRQWPTIDDLRAGRCSEADVLERDASSQPLLSWEEIRQMHESGLVDFQSHSYTHSLVCRSQQIVDFIHPGILTPGNLLELPHPFNAESPRSRPAVRLGEPMYSTAPRLSDTSALFPDHSTAQACAELVESHGGADFFTSPDWRRTLSRKAAETQPTWQHETPEQQREAIRRELAESKRLLEEMLPGKTASHICYPWHIAGHIADTMAREIGYSASYWGKTNGKYYSAIPSNPHQIARVGADFFFRLPGTGRQGLLCILMGKSRRRAAKGSPYLTH